MKRKKRLLAFGMALCVLMSGLAATAYADEEELQHPVNRLPMRYGEEDGEREENEGGHLGGGGRMGGEMAEETDETVLAVIAAAADKFIQLTYDDPATGISLEYSLYVPADYNPEERYPLIQFIPDATGAGKSAKQIVQEYYGADIWASDGEQAKHPCFVLVPAFASVVVNDESTVSPEVNAAVNLLTLLTQSFSIDTDRLYTTGQSMGCMTSLYLNSVCPDLFAASLFVSGQWDVSVLKPLENEKFFYITAGGDERASGGQTEVMQMFAADGVPYSYGEWSAKDSAEAQNAAAGELIAQGHKANMIRFTTGSVLGDAGGMEHMASFNYAYKIEAVRDWLFAQVKD